MTDPIGPSLLQKLIERLQSQEGLELEVKSAAGGLPRSVWPTVSAFANTQGGWILLGVTEVRNTLRVEGVSDPERMVQDLHSLLRNQEKISHPICGPNDISIEQLDGTPIIVVRVPAAPRNSRPVFINGNPYTGTYVRRASGDYHCSTEEVNRMIREASEQTIDSAILSGYGVTDIDPSTLQNYRRRYQSQHVADPWTAYDDDRFLRAMGAFGRNRETGEDGLTVGGLLMLGRPEAVRQWRPAI